MNTRDSQRFAILTILLLGLRGSSAADQVTLELRPTGTQGEIRIHSQMGLPVAAMYPEYTILRSTNLQTWEPVGSPLAGSVGVSDELLRVAVPSGEGRAFYKVMATTKVADGNHGDAVFGYGTEFSKQLQSLGQISLEDFVSRYGVTNEYLPQITFDPTTAQYWTEFNLDPAVNNATNSTEPRLTDFRLNPAEFAVFRTNGFVVSQRLGTYSFADAFYRVYIDDLPVFVSTDAILHAWHRSYITMLEELEETYLRPRLDMITQNMSDQVVLLASAASGTVLTNGVYDADYFLAVARSLLTGTTNPGSLGQSARVIATLNAINSLQLFPFGPFGDDRWMDYSQFQVRGHYTSSPALSNYFRAMMWCSFADFRFTGDTNDNSLRELAGAVAMNMLMQRSGQFTNWKQFDDVVQMFVGPPDSLNFAQWNDVLQAMNLQSPTSLPDKTALENLRAKLMTGQFGMQNIRNNYYFSPLTAAQLKLPRSFTFMGQRFTPEGWALSQCTFDSIIWDTNGIPEFEDKVPRRVPSALDVAFSVFGNDQIVPEIVARIRRTNLTKPDGPVWTPVGREYWRDGWPYQHNLAAVRNVVDAQNASAWTNNIYSCWLAALRALSGATTTAEFPEAMRTRPWAMKTLNSQLASWTELKHDTVLYAKQPYTAAVICSYPYAFVEPRSAFWQRMNDLAVRTRALLATLPTNGIAIVTGTYDYGYRFSNVVSLVNIYTNRLNFIDRFAATMTTLRSISDKELAHAVLSAAEEAFLQDTIEQKAVGCGNGRQYSGWYPSLFYRRRNSDFPDTDSPSNYHDSDNWDALVTDVHTDTFDIRGDPGSVLHEGVGTVDMLLIAVDCDGDRMVYAGPVLSHYEFEMPPSTRMTDEQWKSAIKSRNLPPRPDWTRSYLVPGTVALPPDLP